MTVEEMPSVEQLNMIAEDAWSAYLDPDGDAPLEIDAPQTGPVELTASVAVVGAWNGHLVVACSRNGSRDVASAMLALPADELSADDIGDALGELANVLGGNVKSLLPAPSTLSLPRVGDGADERWPGAVEVCQTAMRWRGEPFRVSLLHSAQHNPQQNSPHNMTREVA